MKNLTKKLYFRGFALSVVMLVAGMVSSLYTFAQAVPEKVEVDVNDSAEAVWYGQPWIWAIGVAVFIVIIVAITRSGQKSKA